MFFQPQHWDEVWSSFRRELASDRPVYLTVLILCVLGFIYVSAKTAFSFDIVGIYAAVWSLNYLLVYPLLMAIGIGARMVHRLDRRRMLALRTTLSAPNAGRFLAGTVLMFAIWPFKSVFTNFKTAMSLETGFTWDVWLANFDKTLHLGVDPGPVLTRIFDSRMLLQIVEFNYDVVWFIMCFSLLYWHAVSPRAAARRVRYVICFVAVWAVLGCMVAQGFLSAGPAFYGAVTGDEARFGAQMAFISSSTTSGMSAHHLQTYLWQLYTSGNQGLGTGISAFPSVHVGLVAMNACFMFEMGRKWAAFGVAYVMFILFSSVYLGWHYAIDGYFSILMVAALYFGVKAIANRRWRWGFTPAAGFGVPTPDSPAISNVEHSSVALTFPSRPIS